MVKKSKSYKRRSKLISSEHVHADSGYILAEVVHCPCGTGCVECYGKINCGCPDCYTPPKAKIGPIRVGRDRMMPPAVQETVQDLPSVLFAVCTQSIVQYVVNEAAVSVVQTKIDLEQLHVTKRHRRDRPVSTVELSSLTKPRNRYSLPALSDFEDLSKVKEFKSRRETEIKEKRIKPAKQTKYYCKKCNIDQCNNCFSKSCTGHNVQWIGQATFICQSALHQFT